MEKLKLLSLTDICKLIDNSRERVFHLDCPIVSHCDQNDFVNCLLNQYSNSYLHGEPVICWAAQQGYDDIVTDLIKKGVKQELTDSHQNIALILACLYGNENEKVVQILLENEKKIDHQNIYNQKALMCASEHGYLDIAKLLIDAKANLNL